MTKLVSFVVPGRLKGKARHRARVATSKSGKSFVQTYPDKETKNAEAMVRTIAHEAMLGVGVWRPFEGPLAMSVVLTKNYPASWPKKRKASTYFITGKPDVDNTIKVLCDSLNGICYGDDAQIAKITFDRHYDDTVGEQVTITIYRPEPPTLRLGSRIVEKPLLAEPVP